MVRNKLIEKATVFKTYREEEQRHQYAELLLEVIQEEMKANKEEYHEELRKVIKIAACKGVVEIVTMCLDIFPSLIWETDERQHRHILHDAIEFRHDKIFNLVRDKLLEDVLQENTWVMFQECKDIMTLAANIPSQSTLENLSSH